MRQDALATAASATPMLDVHGRAAAAALSASLHEPPKPRTRRATCVASKDESLLSPAELRRKRNREAMRRMRQRERDELAVMRQDIRVLEQQYRDALQQQAARFHSATATATAAPAQGDGQLFGRYRQLAVVSKALQQQNFLLQQTLAANRKSDERLERVLADYHQDKVDVEASSDDALADVPVSASASVPKFQPITPAHATELMAICAQDIARFERLTAAQAATPLDGYFGWTIRHKMVDSNVHFLLSKRVPHVHASTASAKAWEMYQSSKSKNGSHPVRVLRFEKLQELNPDAHVVARDMVHPLHQGVVLRSLFLRFRMETPTGFVLARSCMNPSSAGRTPRSQHAQAAAAGGWSHPAAPKPSEDGHKVRYADLTTWVQFDRLDLLHPEQPGCLVKFGGYCDYGTTHDLSQRLVNVLLAAVELERRVLEPLVPLLPGP